MNKVITRVVQQGMPVGSVLQNCIPVTDKEGNACWSGLWCSMGGSYLEVVKQEDCEIWDEEKHDPTGFFIKKHFAEKRAAREKAARAAEEADERATLVRLKLKYEGV